MGSGRPLVDEHETTTWRPKRSSAAALYVVATACLFLAGMVAAEATAGDGPALGWVSAAALVTVALIAAGYARRACIVADADGVEVVNLLRRERCAWHEILWAKPGYSGMVVQLRDGNIVEAMAVQKSNVSAWLRRSTRADAVAAQITERAARAERDRLHRPITQNSTAHQGARSERKNASARRSAPGLSSSTRPVRASTDGASPPR